MEKLSVTVCLGHENLNFSLWLKLGRSDDLIFIFDAVILKAEKRKSNTEIQILTNIIHFINFFLRDWHVDIYCYILHIMGFK